jgi:hypothetical protein
MGDDLMTLPTDETADTERAHHHRRVTANRNTVLDLIDDQAAALARSVEAADIDRIAEVAQALTVVKGRASDLLYDCRRKARPFMPEGVGRYVAGAAVVEKDYGKDRTEWEHRVLLDKVLPGLVQEAMAAGIAVPAADADQHSYAQRVARALAPLLLDVMTPGWKVGEHGKMARIDQATGEVLSPAKPATGLRAHGITPADYCREQTRATVTFNFTGKAR